MPTSDAAARRKNVNWGSVFISFHFPENSLQSRLLRSKQKQFFRWCGSVLQRRGARIGGRAPRDPGTFAPIVRSASRIVPGGRCSVGAQTSGASAVCALPVPSHDQRREEDLPIERCASVGTIRQGRLRRESGMTRRSSLH